MPERRTPRLALEVAFLVALAVALAFTGLRAYEIVGLMLVGWLLAAVFEWGALRSRPHYGRGRPPRFYVPQVSLPPPRPLEQVANRYATAASDAPTWIASPAMLAEWPVADEPVVELAVDEATQVHDALEVELAFAVVERRREPEPQPERRDQPPEPEAGAPPEVAGRTAKHRLDPLGEAPAKARRFGRQPKIEAVYAEVPDRPQGRRLLPGRARRED
jgi:hypothetical protein